MNSAARDCNSLALLALSFALTLNPLACGTSAKDGEHGANASEGGAAGSVGNAGADAGTIDTGGAPAQGGASATGGRLGVPSGGIAPTCSACDDDIACTIDTCRADGSCTHTIGPNEGLTACPRGSYCTVEEGCVQPPACANDADCEEALGDDPCRGNIRCDPASSLCLFARLDKDADGHSPPVCGGDDCNDGDPTVSPSATEACDGLDNNCDGETDEGEDACDIGGPADCVVGTCVCRPESLCDDTCVDFETNPEHCGACEVACGANEVCAEGVCACPDGLVCGALLREYGSEHFIPLVAHQGYVVGARGPYIVAVTPDGSDERWLADGLAWEIQARGDDLFVVGDLGQDTIFQLPFSSAIEDGPVVGRTIFTEFGAPSPGHLVLHEDRIYWINTRREFPPISWTNQTDENVTPQALGNAICDLLAGDSESLYCITRDVPQSLYAVGYEDGSERLILEGIPCSENLRVDDGYVYWSEPCEFVVARVPVGGGDREELDHESSTGVVATSIIPDGDNLYIRDAFGFGVMPSGGGSFLRIVRGEVFGVVADAEYVYWSAADGVYRARKPR